MTERKLKVPRRAGKGIQLGKTYQIIIKTTTLNVWKIGGNSLLRNFEELAKKCSYSIPLNKRINTQSNNS